MELFIAILHFTHILLLFSKKSDKDSTSFSVFLFKNIFFEHLNIIIINSRKISVINEEKITITSILQELSTQLK